MMTVRQAAENLRAAQRAYMADRGNDDLGRKVAHAAATLDAVLAQPDELQAAGLALYTAGRWSCDRPVDEPKLWEDLRDALGLAPGTATAAGVAA